MCCKVCKWKCENERLEAVSAGWARCSVEKAADQFGRGHSKLELSKNPCAQHCWG